MDVLGLNKIKVQANNKGEGLKIDGIFVISKIKALANLVDMLKPGLSGSLNLAFSLTINSWKNITAKISGLMKDVKINNAITLKSLGLIITPSGTAPSFGIYSEISAKICSRDFIFVSSFTVGVVVKFTAEMQGIWENPMKLRNTYVKDLVLEIT